MGYPHAIRAELHKALSDAGIKYWMSQGITVFETCENLSNDGSFTCSNCMSHTDYRPKVPYRFCPMCGAYVIKEA